MYNEGVPAWVVGTESSYERQIQQPVPVVQAALEGIQTDLFNQGDKTGPQFDLPQVVRSETADGIMWQIVKDGQVTVEMTARLTPTRSGAATKVAGSVKLIRPEHGPTERAFQLLFANALDAKLAQLDPASGLNAEQLRDKKQFGDAALTTAAVLEDPMAIARAGLQAEEDERRLERELREKRETDQTNAGVNFKPGEPMIDVNPDHRSR